MTCKIYRLRREVTVEALWFSPDGSPPTDAQMAGALDFEMEDNCLGEEIDEWSEAGELKGGQSLIHHDLEENITITQALAACQQEEKGD